MTKKEQIIKQLKEFDNEFFNEDQKNIILDILQNSTEENVQIWADFLFAKRKIGFGFDYSPEPAKGRIITLTENKKLSINCNNYDSWNENKLIIGDNYNALKSLQLTHKGKIDIIYIDPPYNTESAGTDGNNLSSKEGVSSKFIYKDKFGRNGWLNLMKERLKLAKELLSESGVIFLSIDDTEQAYLNILMNEIFHDENYVGCWPRLKSTQGKNDSNTPISKHEFLLIFSKDKSKTIWNKKENNQSYFNMDDNDGRGPYHLKNYISATEGLHYSNSLDFDIELNGILYEPISKNKRTCWIWNKERILAAEKLNILVPKGKYIYSKKYLNYEFNENNELVPRKSTIHFDSLELLDNSFSNKQGTKDLEIIMNKKKEFNYPKPVKLIKYLVNLVNKKNALILDFFAGSGTTGQAVMELNREDCGNRKFILCTNNENEIAHKVTYERLFRVINGKGTNGETFPWTDQNLPFSNENLRVIEIDDTKSIALEDVDNEDNKYNEIIENAIEGIKLLDNNYDKDNNELNIYFDLAALNPLEKN